MLRHRENVLFVQIIVNILVFGLVLDLVLMLALHSHLLKVFVINKPMDNVLIDLHLRNVFLFVLC